MEYYANTLHNDGFCHATCPHCGGAKKCGDYEYGGGHAPCCKLANWIERLGGTVTYRNSGCHNCPDSNYATCTDKNKMALIS